MRVLRDRYPTRQDILRGDCFYTSLCEPVDAIEELIRVTEEFIREADALAHT